MNPQHKTMFIVKISKGYSNVEIAFDTIQKATEFFTKLASMPLPYLNVVTGKDGEGAKQEAHYIGGNHEITIETREVDLYPSKKAASFSVHGDSDE